MLLVLVDLLAVIKKCNQSCLPSVIGDEVLPYILLSAQAFPLPPPLPFSIFPFTFSLSRTFSLSHSFLFLGLLAHFWSLSMPFFLHALTCDNVCVKMVFFFSFCLRESKSVH